MGLENQVLKEGLVDIQGNLASAVDTAKVALSDIDNITNNFDELTHGIGEVFSDMQILSSDSPDSRNSVEKLLSSTEEISDVLALIKTIANQINLISLNAAVEAARAGEAGRGFAVVANEVKTLSDKTQEALADIDRVVRTMQQSVSKVSKTSKTSIGMTNRAEQAAIKVTHFRSQFHDVDEGLDGKFKNIAGTNHRVFLSLAKLDHMIWNVNTYLSVNKGSPSFDYVDHLNCRLGKWYEHGEGKRYFSHTTAYKQLANPHSIVHRETLNVFKLPESDSLDYVALISVFRSMASSSHGVLSILSEMGSLESAQE